VESGLQTILPRCARLFSGGGEPGVVEPTDMDTGLQGEGQLRSFTSNARRREVESSQSWAL